MFITRIRYFAYRNLFSSLMTPKKSDFTRKKTLSKSETAEMEDNKTKDKNQSLKRKLDETVGDINQALNNLEQFTYCQEKKPKLEKKLAKKFSNELDKELDKEPEKSLNDKLDKSLNNELDKRHDKELETRLDKELSKVLNKRLKKNLDKKPDNDTDKNNPSKLKIIVTSKNELELGDGKFPTSPIKITSWNVNGLRAIMKRGEILSYLQKANPDILCLNETKISERDLEADPNLAKLHQDYYHFFNCSKDRLGYSGVGILTKQKPISLKFNIGILKHDGEGRTITAEFEKFYLVACYVPNAGNKLVRLNYRVNEWDPSFRRYLNELKSKKPTILCGDLNVAHKEIDIYDPIGHKNSACFTKEERQGFTDLLNDGWIDTFRYFYPIKVMYTYYSARFKSIERNAGWRLDYFLINKDNIEAVKDSNISHDTIRYDHIPIELILDLDKLQVINLVQPVLKIE